MAQTLADDTATLTSTLEDFGQLKILHERTLLLYVRRGHIFLIGGYRFKKKKGIGACKNFKGSVPICARPPTSRNSDPNGRRQAGRRTGRPISAGGYYFPRRDGLAVERHPPGGSVG